MAIVGRDAVPLAPGPTQPPRPLGGHARRADRDAAAHVFAERGYTATSIAELPRRPASRRAASTTTSKRKEDLLIAICDELLEPLLAEARGDRRHRRFPPSEQLRDLVRAWVEHVGSHQNHMLVFTQERHVIEREPRWRRGPRQPQGVREAARRRPRPRRAPPARSERRSPARPPRPARDGQLHADLAPPDGRLSADRDRRRLLRHNPRRLVAAQRPPRSEPTSRVVRPMIS